MGDEYEQMSARADVTKTSNSPAMNSATFHSGMSTAETMGPPVTDYFPGVIDTSMFLCPVLWIQSDNYRSMGTESM